ERALREAEARLGASGQGGSFLPPSGGGPAYRAAPPYAAPPQQRGGGAGSFLAGAGQMALGIGGGILVADAAMSLAHGLFGGDGGFGFGQEAGDRELYEDQGGFEGQDDDQAAFEDAGDFDDGSSDW
ncbi:MAG TPA: hypothetical protein VOB72_25730, partial [Candidatus Dormibacteraeota bacterium]|nr:hypothetical protein [Candidatus Dormibacteraeota bacterium]